MLINYFKLICYSEVTLNTQRKVILNTHIEVIFNTDTKFIPKENIFDFGPLIFIRTVCNIFHTGHIIQVE